MAGCHYILPRKTALIGPREEVILGGGRTWGAPFVTSGEFDAVCSNSNYFGQSHRASASGPRFAAIRLC